MTPVPIQPTRVAGEKEDGEIMMVSVSGVRRLEGGDRRRARTEAPVAAGLQAGGPG
jgi:hypothetical protein